MNGKDHIRCWDRMLQPPLDIPRPEERPRKVEEQPAIEQREQDFEGDDERLHDRKVKTAIRYESFFFGWNALGAVITGC